MGCKAQSLLTNILLYFEFYATSSYGWEWAGLHPLAGPWWFTSAWIRVSFTAIIIFVVMSENGKLAFELDVKCVMYDWAVYSQLKLSCADTPLEYCGCRDRIACQRGCCSRRLSTCANTRIRWEYCQRSRWWPDRHFCCKYFWRTWRICRQVCFCPGICMPTINTDTDLSSKLDILDLPFNRNPSCADLVRHLIRIYFWEGPVPCWLSIMHRDTFEWSLRQWWWLADLRDQIRQWWCHCHSEGYWLQWAACYCHWSCWSILDISHVWTWDKATFDPHNLAAKSRRTLSLFSSVVHSLRDSCLTPVEA